MSPHNPLTAYLSERYPEASAMDFYRELFPSGSLASVEDVKVRNRGTYAGVLVRVWSDIDSEGKSIQKVERHSVLDPLDNIEKVITIDSAFSRNADVKDLLSPVSYAGRRPLLNMAHELFALVFDLDELKVDDNGFPCGLDDLIYQMTDLPGRRPALLPVPTYIVSSGTGLHLYYLLDEPIRLWPNVIERLALFRHEFTSRCWNRYVTDLSDKPQFESVIQAFRMVGSPSKSGDQIVRAFRTGERVSMGYMNKFVSADAQLAPSMLRAQYTLDEAKARWPKWNPDWRRRAAEPPERPWKVKRDLYDWWTRRVESGEPFEGNRYWCVFVAACFAAKCPAVTYEELEAWAYRVRPMLDSMTRRPGNEFTEEDVSSALAAYGNPLSPRLTRDKIAEKTMLEMPVNKRNGQSQATHLQGDEWIIDEKVVPNDCKIHREFAYRRAVEEGRVGAPTKSALIRAYAVEHPQASHSEIARALGVSRPTVIKWLKDGWLDEYKKDKKDEAPQPNFNDEWFHRDGHMHVDLIPEWFWERKRE